MHNILTVLIFFFIKFKYSFIDIILKIRIIYLYIIMIYFTKILNEIFATNKIHRKSGTSRDLTRSATWNLDRSEERSKVVRSSSL